MSVGRASPGKPAGCSSTRGYTVIGISGASYMAHRLAFVLMGEEVPDEVDHRNCVKHDNRWDNLRPASRVQNGANRGKWSSRKLPKGVMLTPSGRFRVQLAGFHVGSFDTVSGAKKAYLSAARTKYGDFANGG